jgi:DNA-binding NarL/FixJ family response regulator
MGDIQAAAAKAGGSEPWRILLVEDDRPVRDRLARLIEEWDGGKLVATCDSLGDTLTAIAQHEIDLLITDLRLPGGNGIAAIRQLATTQPEAEAMVISVLADEKTVLQAIEAGASGYLHKDADSIDLIQAITDLMAGRSPISSGIARVLVRRLSERVEDAVGREEGPRPSLTPRETVPIHVRNIYRKLQASNRSEAVFEAARLGLIKL